LLTATSIEVGALGSLSFDPGWYAYTGSALGSGGFARVERHRELAAGERDTRHWHVDYLLGNPAASIDYVARTPGLDAECTIASEVGGDPVPAFGVSDCDCRSHLAFSEQRADLLGSVRRAHAVAGGDADGCRSGH
jgi:endonuclease-3